ncbi:MAG: ATP synthase F1 subunit delta [Treponema sp.]|nr:ATP synthase F1 subunit delta [Treponema sp.]
MKSVRTWAMAFINSAENEGLDIAYSIDTLKELSSQVKALSGFFYGRNAAAMLENLLREEIKKANLSDEGPASLSIELSVRFIILTVRKNMFKQLKLIIDDITRIMNKRWQIIEATMEYALPCEEQAEFENSLSEAIKRRSGASKVLLSTRQNPALLGGYRVRIGDDVFDASIRSQLEELKIGLQSDMGDLFDGGDIDG